MKLVMDDVEKAVAATEAKGRREEEAEKLLKTAREYMLFLQSGMIIVLVVPTVALLCRWPAPGVLPWTLPARYNLLVTCAMFAAVTLLVQEKLARVLERRPAPAPRLTPLGASLVGLCTWMFVHIFVLSYLTFTDVYFRRTFAEWVAGCVASVANLAMAIRTVKRHLA